MHVNDNASDGRDEIKIPLERQQATDLMYWMQEDSSNFPLTLESLLELLRNPGSPILHNVLINDSEDEMVMLEANLNVEQG